MYALNQQVLETIDLTIDTGISIQIARAKEEDRLLFALTSAFANDPPSRWLYPEPEAYRRWFPTFARAFGGGA